MMLCTYWQRRVARLFQKGRSVGQIKDASSADRSSQREESKERNVANGKRLTWPNVESREFGLRGLITGVVEDLMSSGT
jgi:hypothetical protein